MQSRFAASAPVPRRLLPCDHGSEEAPGAQRAVFINFVREQRSLGVFPAEGFFKVDPIVKSFKYGQQTINLETGAAVKGAEYTKQITARLGRAGVVGEKSIGHPDAGAYGLGVIFTELTKWVKAQK